MLLQPLSTCDPDEFAEGSGAGNFVSGSSDERLAGQHAWESAARRWAASSSSGSPSCRPKRVK